MARREEKQRDLAEMKRIGARIRQARLARGLTLDQASEWAETSNQFLSQVEKGEQSMTMVKFSRLAKALGVSSDYLLYGRGRDDAAALAAEYLGAMSPLEREILAQTVIHLHGLLDAAPGHD